MILVAPIEELLSPCTWGWTDQIPTGTKGIGTVRGYAGGRLAELSPSILSQGVLVMGHIFQGKLLLQHMRKGRI